MLSFYNYAFNKNALIIYEGLSLKCSKWNYWKVYVKILAFLDPESGSGAQAEPLSSQITSLLIEISK